MQRLLKAIQERKIDRVAAAYAVAAWILVQAASIGLPTFGAPAWMMKLIIVAVLTGFPLALWITWHAAAPARNADEARIALRRTDMALMAVLAVVLLLIGAQFAFQLGAFPGKGRTVSAANPPGAASVRTGPPPTSIAVLPFLNLSGDPKREFFSDGISEELLNDLANTPKLRVAARTSCFAFKGKNEDIRKIARALNVGAILEGSVREDGQHIRITAQLINASDGYHLWSKTYDRDLSNILQVQDEIAQAITVALTHTLGGGFAPPKHSLPAIDPDAYRQYLKGQYLSALKTDEGDAQAVTLFKQVTAREPKFAPAYAALGRTYIHMAEFHNKRADLLQSADEALKKALQVDPRNLEALSTDLRLATLRWNWERASEDYRRLLSVNSHSVFTLRGLSFYYEALGFGEQRIVALREAIRLDPLSFVDLNNLASAYNDRARYVEGAAAALNSLSLKPDRPLALYSLCWAYAGLNQIDKARGTAHRLLEVGQTDASEACSLWMATLSGDLRRARLLADAAAARFPSFVFGEADIGYFYALSREFAAASPWLERAYNKHDATLFSLVYSPTTPPSLLQSAMWTSIMARPEARTWRAAHDRLAKELAQK
ncbi:MAG: hypothetical protein ACJ8IR_14110 [Alphaproteobacteria bacterium]